MSRLHSFYGHLLTGSSVLFHQSLGNTDLRLEFGHPAPEDLPMKDFLEGSQN